MTSRLPSHWLQAPALEQGLQRLSRARFVALAVLAALVLSLVFHAPKLWLLRHEVAGSFEWSRGTTFRAQATAPWEAAAEPAMRWRLLPAWTAYLIGLRSHRAFAFPWLGLIAWLGLTALLLDRHGVGRTVTLGGTVVLATTGSALAATNWFGINDGWYLAGLTAVVLARSAPSLAAAVLLCPWVDERFLMALPLAAGCRFVLESGRLKRDAFILGLGAAFYVAVRLTVGLIFPTTSSADQGFLTEVFRHLSVSLTWAPFGWLLGWRFAWLLLLAAPLLVWSSGQTRPAVALFLLGAGTLASQALVASDHSRTAIVLLPLALVALAHPGSRRCAGLQSRAVLALALLSLAAPFAHVVFNKVVPVNSIPWELARLRHPA